MYNNWLQKLTESYTQAKRELTESEMILEELNETKEYASILEHVLNTLLEHEVINEEIIMEVLSPYERLTQTERMGLDNEEAQKRYGERKRRLDNVARRRDELRNDPSWGNTHTSVASAQWSHANRLLSGADFPFQVGKSARSIDRRVPEGSPEESDIASSGLHAAGIDYPDPEIMKTAIGSIRSSRRISKEVNAEAKRRARAREQRKQGN